MARWIKSEEEEDLYVCSECKASFYHWAPESSVEKMTKFFPKCPKCMSDMTENKEADHD